MARRKALSPLSPLARPGAVLKLDPRGAEFKMIRRIEQELIEQLGGDPTPVERLLIRKAAILEMRFEVSHRDFMTTGKASDNANRFMLTTASVSSGILAKLGLERRRPSPLTLEQYIELKAANE